MSRLNCRAERTNKSSKLFPYDRTPMKGWDTQGQLDLSACRQGNAGKGQKGENLNVHTDGHSYCQGSQLTWICMA